MIIVSLKGAFSMQIDATDLFRKEDIDDPYYEEDNGYAHTLFYAVTLNFTPLHLKIRNVVLDLTFT